MYFLKKQAALKLCFNKKVFRQFGLNIFYKLYNLLHIFKARTSYASKHIKEVEIFVCQSVSEFGFNPEKVWFLQSQGLVLPPYRKRCETIFG